MCMDASDRASLAAQLVPSFAEESAQEAKGVGRKGLTQEEFDAMRKAELEGKG
jgi:hypothetical protein